MVRSSFAARTAAIAFSFLVLSFSLASRASSLVCPGAVSASRPASLAPFEPQPRPPRVSTAPSGEPARYSLTIEEAATIAQNASASHPRAAIDQIDFMEKAVGSFLDAIDPEGLLVLESSRRTLADRAQARDPELLMEFHFGVRTGQGLLARAQAEAGTQLARLEQALASPEFQARILALSQAGPERPAEPGAPANAQGAEEKLAKRLAGHLRHWLSEGFQPQESLEFVVRNTVDGLVAQRHMLLASAYPTALLSAFIDALDAHSAYLPPQRAASRASQMRGNFVGIGVILKSTPRGAEVASVVRGGGAHQAGVRAGDLISRIEGRDVLRKSFSDLADDLRGEQGTQVRVELVRQGERVDAIIHRSLVAPASRTAVQVFSIDDPSSASGTPIKLGAVRLSMFGHGTAKEVVDAVASVENKIEGLVLDFRGNGGGSLDEALGILAAFLPPGPTLLVTGAQQNTLHASRTPAIFDLPLIVLVDGESASASELVAGVLQARRRAVVVGSRTFGKGTYQGQIPLESGHGVLSLTGGYFFFPNGRTPQNVGVAPDVPISNAIEPERREERLPRALPSVRTQRLSPEDPELERMWTSLTDVLRERAGARRFSEGNEPSPGGFGVENADPGLHQALRILGDLVDLFRD